MMDLDTATSILYSLQCEYEEYNDERSMIAEALALVLRIINS